MRNMIVLLDGASDEGIPQFGGKTVLGQAKLPFIDSVASSGVFGCTEPRPYTHLFLLELFSQREGEVPRGLIETLGFDLEVPPGRVAYRLSPAIINGDWMEWGYNITPRQVETLREAMESNLHMLDHLSPRIRYYKDGKGVMTILAKEALELPSPPVNTHLDMESLGYLREFIERIGEETGGIVEMPWQGGKGDLIQEYECSRERLGNIMVYSNSPSALGVGVFLGMDKVWIDDLEERVERAVISLEGRDVLLHIEEIDDASHKRDPGVKMEVLNEVDRLLDRYLKGKEGVRLSLIVDHGASSLSGEHIMHPVPFAVSEDLSGRSQTRRFEETDRHYVALRGLLDVLYHP